MSAGGILEFLNELSESESLAVLNEANNQRSTFVFKFKESAQPLATLIDTFIDRKVILSTDKVENSVDLDQEITLKFNVGTEVYFLKTKLKRYLNKVCFDMNAKVLQLKRRKEPRYLVPVKWNQSASFVCLDRANFIQRVKCQVVDISLSGIRIEFNHPDLKFVRDNEIKIQFQIYKRAEIELLAQTRFFLDKKAAGCLMGLEFQNMIPLHKEKIESIVEDIKNFQLIQKK